MKRESWIVTLGDTRGANGCARCCYCSAALGAEHDAECVCRKRTVIVRFVFEIAVDVPESWDSHSIEFLYNESSSCADNIKDRLEEVSQEHCLCGRMEARFIREATESDEEANGIFVAGLGSE